MKQHEAPIFQRFPRLIYTRSWTWVRPLKAKSTPWRPTVFCLIRPTRQLLGSSHWKTILELMISTHTSKCNQVLHQPLANLDSSHIKALLVACLLHLSLPLDSFGTNLWTEVLTKSSTRSSGVCVTRIYLLPTNSCCTYVFNVCYGNRLPCDTHLLIEQGPTLVLVDDSRAGFIFSLQFQNWIKRKLFNNPRNMGLRLVDSSSSSGADGHLESWHPTWGRPRSYPLMITSLWMDDKRHGKQWCFLKLYHISNLLTLQNIGSGFQENPSLLFSVLPILLQILCVCTVYNTYRFRHTCIQYTHPFHKSTMKLRYPASYLYPFHSITSHQHINIIRLTSTLTLRWTLTYINIIKPIIIIFWLRLLLLLLSSLLLLLLLLLLRLLLTSTLPRHHIHSHSSLG